jgi:hypothetical protein
MGGNTGRTAGIILIVAGLGFFVLMVGWLFVQAQSESLTGGGAVLGALIAFIFIVVPLVGIGAFLYLKGSQEAREEAQVQQQRRILDMVLTRGQVRISDMVLELKSTREQVQAWIYDLVGKELFSGYVNWSEGILYSRDASQLRGTNKCPNCGGQVELAGKGIVRCPYCGSDIFLS